MALPSTMAPACFTLPSSSSSSFLVIQTKPKISASPKPSVSSSLTLSINFPYPNLSFPSASSLQKWPTNKIRCPTAVSAIVDEEPVAVAEEEVNGGVSDPESKNRARPCEIYVCNLPRSLDISDLVEMFKPFGSVVSVEISRNADTGLSRGSGYITMSSINSAKNAIAALDGSDVGGREVRVRFSVDMNSKRRNPEALNSTPKKNIIFESPYKLYVGNLAWAVKPEDLRNHFSQFGMVVSARVLQDRKEGKNRAYGFLSFSSAAERDAAISFNSTEFRGRKLVVREGLERSEP